jgi:capsular exopolysaccharide synthesis family protein
MPVTYRIRVRLNNHVSNGRSHLRVPPAVASQLGSLVESLSAQPRALRTIALVGSGRREGTSTCTASLGAYLASRHARVLMVDVNPHNPALHEYAGVDIEKGLAELLDGSISITSAVKATAIPNLFVLPSGYRSQFSTNGLVLPAALRERVLNWVLDYDYVLLDCPAVNEYHDAAAAAALCDGAILVIEGGRTQRRAAQAAKLALSRANCNVIGVFLNKRKFYIPQFLYDRL